MIKVIFLANFQLKETGIFSTASRILRNFSSERFEIFSEEDISIGSKSSLSINDLVVSRNDKVVIFSHLECSSLPLFLKKYTDAIVHVGDWPGNYWSSLMKNGKYIRGGMGWLRFYLKCMRFSKKVKLLFVTEEDTNSARRRGFCKARTLLIGVDKPNKKIADTIDKKKIIFTGNFKYEPNYLAAVKLISLTSSFPDIIFKFAGYNAHLLEKFSSKNIKVYSAVPSIVDFLCENRGIYVSLVQVGAGAKNKIMEALISGCPIICTKESIDSSITYNNSIFLIDELTNTSMSNILTHIENHSKGLNSCTVKNSELILSERSWKAISQKLESILYEN